MNFSFKCVIASAMLLATVTSCNDTPFTEGGGSGGAITFKNTTTDIAKNSRGNGENNSYRKLSATELTNSNKWLIAAEEQGIDKASFGDKTTMSRGEQITLDNFYTQFKVYAYTYSADYTSFAAAAAADKAELFMNGLTAQKSADENGVWATNPTYYWKKDNLRITFYGIAPAAIDGNTNYTISSSVAAPQLSYSVADNATSQPDVLLAEKTCLGDGSNDENVELNFKHLLTAIKLKVKTAQAADLVWAKDIKTVTFKHVKYEGTYNFMTNSSWNLADKYKNFTVTINNTGEAENGELALIDGENTLMMMPQTFSGNADAAIEITLNDGTTLSSALKDANIDWSKGNTITYYISNSQDNITYHLETPTSISFSWDKDSKRCPVKSYKTIEKTDGSNTKYNVYLDWKPTVTKVTPDFVDGINTYDTNINHENHTDATPSDSVVISTLRTKDDMVKITDSEDVATLKAAAVKGSNSSKTAYYDLSTNKTGSDASNRTTANCYIINSPGYYRIPLAYGDAIQNGSTVSSGTYSFSSGDYRLTGFKEHYDWAITSAWITAWNSWGDDYKPAKVKVLWQDSFIVRDAFAYVGDMSDNNDSYLYFRILESDIRPGNVVLVLLDGKSMPLWTWHLWVTPIKSGDNITFYNAAGGGAQSSFLKYPLGYINEPTRHYPKRTAELVIDQYDGDVLTLTNTVDLIQAEHDFSPISAPYYQFGRMVPFPGAICSEVGGLDEWDSYQYEMEDKQCVDGSGNAYEWFVDKSTRPTIGAAIRNPDIFYASEDASWASEVYYNLWGCRNNKDFSSAYKTVYDPCPPGYKVPPIYSFPSLTFDNSDYGSKLSELSTNVINEADLFAYYWNTPFTNHLDYIDYFGFKFYTSKMSALGQKTPTTETILFPALGYRIAAETEVTGAAAVGLTRHRGGVHNMGGYFYYWSASQSIDSSGNSETYFPQGGYILGNCSLTPISHSKWPARGLPVWPMLGS